MAQQPVLSNLSDELAPPLRLAAAYAPGRARGLWTALLLLDSRLGRAALRASEPLVGQLRLAWWRDRFRSSAATWPEGEPLLAELAAWDGERPALEGLVDGWERLVGGDPDPSDIAELAGARAEAVLALARLLGCAARMDAVAAMARYWALADLAHTLGSNEARDLAAAAETRAARLPRALRPLIILMDLPRWGEVQSADGSGLRALLRIVRLGMVGR